MSLKFSEVKKGDRVYESAYGVSYALNVLTDPVRHEREDGSIQWTFEGESWDGHIVNYLSTEGYEHYGPRLSRTFEYAQVKTFPEEQKAMDIRVAILRKLMVAFASEINYATVYQATDEIMDIILPIIERED